MDTRLLSLGAVRAMKLALMLIILGFSSHASAATMAVWSDGVGTNLLGFDNFEFQGNTYDIDFIKGTCDSLFSQCSMSGTNSFPFPNDSSTTQSFRNMMTADQMIQDALASVKVDDGYTVPGCDFNNSGDCVVMLPFMIPQQNTSMVGVWYWVLSKDANGLLGQNTNQMFSDMVFYRGQTEHLTYMVITETVVPLPAAAWFLISGIAGMGLFSRRKQIAV